jgi:hypothetical protein
LAATLLRPIHVSYATANLSQAARFLRRSAERHGLDTRIYGPDSPVVADLRERYPAIMTAKRGAGYWLWKPFIVLDAMNSVPDGTAVLYTDIALTFVADPAPLLALAQQHPVCLFGISLGEPASAWTKRDCFVELGADTPDYWNLPLLLGGFQLYRAGPQARAFLKMLCETMANDAALTDKPNIHGLPDLLGFREHRHDQSILTILAHREGTPIFPDPSQFGDWDRQPNGLPFRQIFHLHRKRDTHLPNLLWRQLRGAYTGGRGFA